jgi:nicotinate-nucleotide--dimethylbenzimidazole phosphoribosyltransferase
MIQFNIQPIAGDLTTAIQRKIDFKTKPVGSLGMLEKLALQICNIQGGESPRLERPAIVVFAGDHGIAGAGVSPYPQDVTHQMVMNFLNGGAAINVFCKQNGIDLRVVDAGVNFEFPESAHLVDAKIGFGTRNCLSEPAMTEEQCGLALKRGAEICEDLYDQGSNIIGFGEMGIGNTSAASLIMSKLCHLTIEECIGRGAGLNDAQLKNKIDILTRVINKHKVDEPFEVLRTFGGFEMAMMCGAMLKAAELQMIVLVDGFIASSVFLVAQAMYPNVLDYAIFCHQSDEQGHTKMLNYLGATPLLKLGMCLGEGTGCAVAFPIIKSAVSFLNEMANFESAGVSQKE